MKKLFILLLAMLSVTANAQEEKKSYVGGSLGFWHEKTTEEAGTLKTTSMHILPEIGQWLNEHFAVGATLGFGQTNAELKQKMNPYNPIKTTTRAITISPYFRYEYFQKELVGLFFDGVFGIGVLKQKEQMHNFTTYEIGLRPGVSFHVSNRIHLHGHFGFLGVKGNSEDGFYAGGISLDATEFTLGMVWNY